MCGHGGDHEGATREGLLRGRVRGRPGEAVPGEDLPPMGLPGTRSRGGGDLLPLPSARSPAGLAGQASWTDTSWLPSWPAIVETIDHKPSHPLERARIEAAGGQVCGGRKARIDGNLAVSRGLGDFDFKGERKLPAAEQKVSCIPDIYEVSGIQKGALLLLACDGLWDVMTTKQAAAFVRSKLKKDPEADLGAIAAELIRFCLRMESSDNLTVMIVQFIDGSDWANTQDEMMGFEKLARNGLVDKDTRKQYKNFLLKVQFPKDWLESIQDKEDTTNTDAPTDDTPQE